MKKSNLHLFHIQILFIVGTLTRLPTAITTAGASLIKVVIVDECKWTYVKKILMKHLWISFDIEIMAADQKKSLEFFPHVTFE